MGAAIDSNSTQAYYGEEATLGVQSPGPFWPIEPNSYATWGADAKSVTRAPINISRQKNKGTTSEIDIAAGFNTDYTHNNVLRLMQGFTFSDIREKARTTPMNAVAPVLINSVAVGSYTLASAIAAFKPKTLIHASNFGNASNNGLMVATAVAGAVITAAPLLTGTTAVEAAPPATARLTAVGMQLSAAATLTGLAGAVCIMTDTGTDFTTWGLIQGEWIYLGDKGNATAAKDFNFYGDVTAKPVRGYARIGSITTTTIVFDFCTFGNLGDNSAAVKTGGGVAINVYFGSFLKNEATLALIKRRSYTLPRYLGKGVGNADQLETMLGCVPDKFTLTLKQGAKLECDFSFVGIGSTYTNVAMLTGTIGTFYNEPAFNLSQDLFASLLTVVGTESSSLFAYATDVTVTIDNGATAAKALGSVSGFDISVGDFSVSGKTTLYFNDINAIAAVQNNADTGITEIFARKNTGMIFDVPLVTLGGGQLKIEQNKKITCDVTQDGATNANGYTAAITQFYFLPDSAMSGYKGL